jgi:hypothetical protein
MYHQASNSSSVNFFLIQFLCAYSSNEFSINVILNKTLLSLHNCFSVIKTIVKYTFVRYILGGVETTNGSNNQNGNCILLTHC